MKIVGFIESHDSGIIKPEYLAGTKKTSKSDIDYLEKQRIDDYLINNKRIFGITLSLSDGDKHIGPYALFTDGEWIWPSHYLYHLKKSEYADIDTDFLEHMRGKNFEIQVVPIDAINRSQDFLKNKLLNW